MTIRQNVPLWARERLTTEGRGGTHLVGHSVVDLTVSPILVPCEPMCRWCRLEEDRIEHADDLVTLRRGAVVVGTGGLMVHEGGGDYLVPGYGNVVAHTEVPLPVQVQRLVYPGPYGRTLVTRDGL